MQYNTITHLFYTKLYSIIVWHQMKIRGYQQCFKKWCLRWRAKAAVLWIWCAWDTIWCRWHNPFVVPIIRTVWVKKIPPLGDLTFFHFFHKRLRICKRFFTHLLNVPVFARLQIFIQLLPILTKLCHVKRDYAVHIICAKCPPSAKTRAFRRLHKSLIALLIVVYGKSL